MKLIDIKDKAKKAYKAELARQREEEKRQKKEKDARDAKYLKTQLKQKLNLDVNPQKGEIEIDGITFFLGFAKIPSCGTVYHLNARFEKHTNLHIKGWADVGALLEGREL